MKDVRQLDSVVISVFLTVTWADVELEDRQKTMQQLEAANQIYTVKCRQGFKTAVPSKKKRRQNVSYRTLAVL